MNTYTHILFSLVKKGPMITHIENLLITRLLYGLLLQPLAPLEEGSVSALFANFCHESREFIEQRTRIVQCETHFNEYCRTQETNPDFEGMSNLGSFEEYIREILGSINGLIIAGTLIDSIATLHMALKEFKEIQTVLETEFLLLNPNMCEDLVLFNNEETERMKSIVDTETELLAYIEIIQQS